MYDLHRQQTFAKKRQLMEHHHLRKHHNTFTCGVCQKRFTRKDNLDRNERKHNNDSFFPCNEVCTCLQQRVGFSNVYPKRKVLADGVSTVPLDI
jgi:hypothetical protein